MRMEDFDYQLPEELIAQHPIYPRDASRLLLLNKETGAIAHSYFHELGKFLRPGDMLVLNESRVIPARIYAHKPTGGAVEVMLLKQRELDLWEALVRPGRRVPAGTELLFPHDAMHATVEAVLPEGLRLIRFSYEGNFYAILDEIGQMPLPPYIKEELQDQGRYQPVYARENGSAAAPTAGLHFTFDLLDALEKQGVEIAKLLLHVGLGTFRPVKVDEVEAHQMHSEYYEVSAEAAEKINRCRAAGGRIIAVGTTSCRTLETVADENGLLVPAQGWTEKYIYPGYRFKIVDALITNFHLPKSTLLLLVSALAGREAILQAYQTAIQARYRFFSFGDAMFIY